MTPLHYSSPRSRRDHDDSLCTWVSSRWGPLVPDETPEWRRGRVLTAPHVMRLLDLDWLIHLPVFWIGSSCGCITGLSRTVLLYISLIIQRWRRMKRLRGVGVSSFILNTSWDSFFLFSLPPFFLASILSSLPLHHLFSLTPSMRMHLKLIGLINAGNFTETTSNFLPVWN